MKTSCLVLVCLTVAVAVTSAHKQTFHVRTIEALNKPQAEALQDFVAKSKRPETEFVEKAEVGKTSTIRVSVEEFPEMIMVLTDNQIKHQTYHGDK